MIDADLNLEFEAIQGEAMGWLPIGDAAYVHIGDDDSREVIVIGVPDVNLAGANLLLLV